MYRLILLCLSILLMQVAGAQHTFKTIVKDKHSGAFLDNVNIILSGSGGGKTNAKGYFEIQGIAAGRQVVTWSHTGFLPVSDTLIFPLYADTIIVEMQEAEAD